MTMTSLERFVLLVLVGMTTSVLFTNAQSQNPSVTAGSVSNAAGTCSTSWTSASNTNYAGGTVNAAATVDDCKTACINQGSCVAIDWNPTNGAGQQCWILTSLTGQMFTTQGITHYNITRTCNTGSTGGACTSWSSAANTNYAGGTANGAGNSADCQTACINQATCVAIDWNPNNGAGQQCWILTSLTGQMFTTQGITHYNLTRTCNADSTTPAACVPTWSYVNSTNYQGGTSNAATTVDDCKAACITQTSCVAIDYNTNNAPNCFLLTSLTGTMTNYAGINHYDLTRCGSGGGGTGTGYYIVFVKSTPGAVYVTSTGELGMTTNINQATWFSSSPCLGIGLSGFNASSTCISWLSVDQPGWYIRDLWGTAVLQSRAGQAFDDRFRQDASINQIFDNNAVGFFAAQPVVWASNKYYYYYDGSLIKTAVFQSVPDSAAWFAQQVTQYSSPVTATTPYTWSKVSRAKPYSLSNSLYFYTTSADCRARCLTYPNCIGVATNSGPGSQYSAACYLVIRSQALTAYLVPDNTGYNFYELTRTYPYTTSRGCITTWVQNQVNFIQFYATYRNFSAYQCSRSASGAVGYTWSTGNNCTLYYQNQGSTYPNATYLVWQSSKTSTNCDCAPSLENFQGYSDVNAVLQSGVTGMVKCLTACINNRQCTGFDINNGNCYLSLSSPPTLTLTSGSNHYEVTRSSCGNGCQDNWQLFANTAMNTVTANAAVSEHECRKACQAIPSPGCTGVDWNIAGSPGSQCFLATSASTFNAEGTTAGFNHFVYYENEYCD